MRGCFGALFVRFPDQMMEHFFRVNAFWNFVGQTRFIFFFFPI